jgi:hypothetical protein
MEFFLKIILIWKWKAIEFLKMKMNEWKWNFRICMLRKLNGDLMERMHFVGVFCVNDNKEIDHNNLQMM